MLRILRSIALHLLLLAAIAGNAQPWQISLDRHSEQYFFWSIDFASSDVGYVIGNDSVPSKTGIVFRTKDAGLNWDSIPLPQTTSFGGVSAPTEQVTFISGSERSLFKTEDGGDTWTNIGNHISDTSVNGFGIIKFINADTGFVIAGSSNMTYMYRTSNGGNSWMRVKSWSTLSFSEFFFVNDQVGYLRTYCSILLYKTEDGGLTWNLTSYVANSNGFCQRGLFFFDEDEGYFALDGALSHTTDGGNTWTVDSSSTLNNIGFYGLHFLTRSHAIGAPGSYLGAMFHSYDGGETWQPESAPGCGGFNHMHFPNNEVGYACSYNGYVYKYINQSTGMEDRSDSESFAVYPNPADDYLTIEAREAATYLILDLQGRVLMRDKLHTSETLDISSLPGGLYFIHFQGSANSYTTKFLVN